MGDREKTDTLSTKTRPHKHRAVIDIGSNSVRLVIYDGPARTPMPIFNEKALCGLGRREGQNNNLLQEAMTEALQVLKRFSVVLSLSKVADLQVFATAAVREADNGPAFLAKARQLGFDPVVFSGDEEARFAALGVLSGAPAIIAAGHEDRPHLCGDMGGGSLELTRFTGDKKMPLAERISLPLGPFRLMSTCGPVVAAAVDFVQEHLQQHAWLNKPKTDILHAVGGAWRAVAKVHMAKHAYPLPILQQYELDRAGALEICELLERQSPASLEAMPGVPRKRVETLPHAAMVLRQVLLHTRAQKIVISSSGVREGVLFDTLTKKDKTSDPFIILAEEYARLYCPDPTFGLAAFELTHGLICDESPSERKIRQAACLMCDVAAYHHPDMRSTFARDMALRSPFMGVDHGGRVALAAALYQRHCGKVSLMPGMLARELLSDRLMMVAQIIGLALRFAAEFSSKNTRGLDGCTLRLANGMLVFSGPAHLAPLMGDVPLKRLSVLGARLDVNPMVKFL